jgi:hypothetical protein
VKRATRRKQSEAMKKLWQAKREAASLNAAEKAVGNTAESKAVGTINKTVEYVAEPRRERSAYNIVLRRPDGTYIEINERGW